MKRKLLIIGATGFVGRHFADEMAKSNEKYWHLVLNIPPEHPSRQAFINASEKEGNFSVAWADIEDYYELRDITRDVKACINFSRIPWNLKPERKARIDYENTVDNIFQACLGNGVQKIIHVTCALVFGPTNQRRKSSINDQIPRQLGSVSRSLPRFIKALESEFHHLQQYVVERLFPINVVYLPFLFGLGENRIIGELMIDYLLNEEPVLQFLVQRKNKGKNRINLLHVSEAVSACKHVLSESYPSRQYLIAGEDITLQELLEAWRDAGFSRMDIEPDKLIQALDQLKFHWMNKFLIKKRFTFLFKTTRQQLKIKKENKQLLNLLNYDWSFTPINWHGEVKNTIEKTISTLRAFEREILRVVEEGEKAQNHPN